MKKSFIEVDFPIKEVSDQSVREKNIRHGHISTLHIWWARRPLAASRASILAALVPDPGDEKKRKELKKSIAEISKWENSNNKELLEKARNLIKKAYPKGPPKVLDCFAGGGSIPLEALRFGCETYAMDLNPVAVLILKATLEYPQKYGQSKKIKVKKEGELLETEREINPLVEDVKKWGNWVLEEARKELKRFYPEEPDGSIPVGYIWARTLECQNPSCGAEIPLMRQFWLCKKPNKKIAFKLVIDKKNKKINFKIVKDKEIDSDPSVGTTARASVRCPVCNSVIDANTTRKLFREGKASERMIAVVLHKPGVSGKTYQIAGEKDFEVFKQAEKYLEKKVKNWKWDFNPVPEEEIPLMSGVFNVPIYGITKWGDLFNSRQKLSMITYIEKTRSAYSRMLKVGVEENRAKAILTYIAFVLGRIPDANSTICHWDGSWEKTCTTFARQAIPMNWDFIEANVFGEKGYNFGNILRTILLVLEKNSGLSKVTPEVLQASATGMPWSDDFFDAVITDPPYYINVPYADLSDFFYVWLKRAIGDLYPELFATPLTPKTEEIAQMQHWDPVRYKEKGKTWFESMLTKSFQEINRVLKPDGIAVIVFAHSSTEAWETIINSLLDSNLVLTSSWPIHTEMRARLRAKESAALASSIYMVCRKRTEEETAYFKDVKPRIEQRIKEKLTQFWNEGIRGSDFFISAIGPAIEVFGKYSKVLRLSGEEVSVKELLEYIRKTVSEFALERILKKAELGGVDIMTRFYLLWRWTYNTKKVHFDDARKLAQAVGFELSKHWDKGKIIKKEKEFIRVLGPKDREEDEKFVKEIKKIVSDVQQEPLFEIQTPAVELAEQKSIIDILHHALLLWEKGQKRRVKNFLEQSGFLRNDVFWQTAQAISEVLPKGEKEKQLLQGLLYSKEEYQK